MFTVPFINWDTFIPKMVAKTYMNNASSGESVSHILPSANYADISAHNYLEAVREANKANLELNDINNQNLLDLTNATNKARLEESQRDRDFQLMMSSTAHQREVEDLKKAGINPILSANGGASVTGGSMAVLDTPASNRGSVQPEVLDLSQVASILSNYGTSIIGSISDLVRGFSYSKKASSNLELAQAYNNKAVSNNNLANAISNKK